MDPPEFAETAGSAESNTAINPSWYGKPVEEIDPFIFEDTFCVISKKYKKHYIYRFSCTNSLYAIGPLNPLRRLAIFIVTHQWFDILIILTILANCVTLGMSQNKFEFNETSQKIEKFIPGYEDTINNIEYAFLGVYTLEMVLKIIAKGFVINKFSYLRNRWNILDFIVVTSGYITIILQQTNIDTPDDEDGGGGGELEVLRTFRVLRAVKTISILPGLRMMINALLSSVVQLLEVMALTLFCLMIFALFALEVFMGKLRYKCVKDVKLGDYATDTERDYAWGQWVDNKDNWLQRDYPAEEFVICANNSGTRRCEEEYTCLAMRGGNPDDGWTSFDHFFASMLTTFQLITLDYWERIYDLVLSTSGPWSILFFTMVVFLGSYYLLNLMLAVVAMSYEAEAHMNDQGPLTKHQKLSLVRTNSTFSFEDLTKLNVKEMTYYRKRTPSEREMIAKKLRNSSLGKQPEENEGAFGETILNMLGLRMSLGEEIRRLQSQNSNNSFESPNLSLHRADSDETAGSASVTIDMEGRKIAGKDGRGEAPDVDSGALMPRSISSDDLEIEYLGERKVRQDWLKRYFRRWSLVLKIRLRPVVNHCLFDVFITACIICNTVLLASEHHGQTQEMKAFLETGNQVFMAIFTAEALVKLMALQMEYFNAGWNIFDIIIVGVSYIDFIIEKFLNQSVIRGMRLLRVFKLAQSWITMKVLLNIIFSTFGALGNLTLVLLIVIYIFAVMGMQVVGPHYRPEAFQAEDNPANFPRWHFQNFWFAFMMVFRVLCGEWIEPLWDCLKAQEYIAETGETPKEYKCFLIFLPILIVGNFIVLNLFLALLLNSFNTEELKAQRDKELEATGRSDNLKTIVGMLLKKDKHEHGHAGSETQGSPESTKVIPKVEISAPETPHASTTPSNATATKEKEPPSIESFDLNYVPANTGKANFKFLARKVILGNRKETALKAIEKAGDYLAQRENHTGFYFKPTMEKRRGSVYGMHSETTPTLTDNDRIIAPGDCIPKRCWNADCCLFEEMRVWDLSKWDNFRQFAVTIVGHPTFEWLILTLIFASSITLAFEDKHLNDEQNKTLKKVLFYMNLVFTIIFFFEMLLKWFAMGLWGYFTNAWTILDGFIVLISLVTLYSDASSSENWGSDTGNGSSSHLGGLKAFRTLRALRPLRAISRWQGMKIVVNALMYAIPSIFNVLLVCLLFWLVFSIMGVQFFKGKFYRCVDAEGTTLSHTIVFNRTECCAKQYSLNYSWINTTPNFDNVLEGYLSLFQIATFEGWMELMQSAVDSTEIDMQPERDKGIVYYLFFVIFIVFGSFFTLNLFIGVIIDNFNMLKKKYEGNLLEVMLTPSQRHYYTAMKKLGRKKPRKVIKRPNNIFISPFYDIAMSRKFEITIFIMIFINMVVMSFENNGQRPIFVHLLAGLNSFFTTIYALEATVKIIGLRHYYFTVPWNVFDFVLVLASIVDLMVGDLTVEFPIPPTMLRIVRVFRIGRVLRLIKSAKGIRKLLFALIVSLPALFNIGALLALITFIYAILGMALFKDAPRNNSIDDMFNFETFVNSALMLFRLMTAAGWNDVLDALSVETPLCGSYRKIICGIGNEPSCPNRGVAVAYIVSYIIVSFLIVINMYIAIILENFVEANREEEVGIVEDDLEMFYVRWSRFDPQATQFITFDRLSDFLASLDPPLLLRKPNIVAIVAFNLPIARGNKIHCLDILHSLVKHVLGQIDDTEEFRKLQEQMERKFQKQFPTRRLLDVVSSTRVWKIQQNAAIIIQRAWRKYRIRKHPPPEKQKATTTTKNLGPTHQGGVGNMLHRMGNLLHIGVGNDPKGKGKRPESIAMREQPNGGSASKSKVPGKTKSKQSKGKK